MVLGFGFGSWFWAILMGYSEESFIYFVVLVLGFVLGFYPWFRFLVLVLGFGSWFLFLVFVLGFDSWIRFLALVLGVGMLKYAKISSYILLYVEISCYFFKYLPIC